MENICKFQKVDRGWQIYLDTEAVVREKRAYCTVLYCTVQYAKLPWNHRSINLEPSSTKIEHQNPHHKGFIKYFNLIDSIHQNPHHLVPTLRNTSSAPLPLHRITP
jgi:hypothetical protein